MLTNEQKATLEALVDQHNLVDVLEALANVCHDKADHLFSNWQDQAAGKVWMRAGVAIDKCSDLGAVKDTVIP